jgi:hypothetical protein
MERLYLNSGCALGPDRKDDGIKDDGIKDDGMMNLVASPLGESYSIVGTCINCTAPASLLATITLIAIGVAMAIRSERRDTPRDA